VKREASFVSGFGRFTFHDLLRFTLHEIRFTNDVRLRLAVVPQREDRITLNA
jgi:hypothetical protein